MKTKISPLLLAFVVFGIALVGVAVTRSTGTRNPQDTNEQKKIVEAIRRGGLREAAKIKGRYIGIHDASWDWANYTVEGLAKNSVAVILGTPERSSAQLNSTGDSIATHFSVRIDELIKGDADFAAYNRIIVAVPGGKIEFENGTSAEVQTPGFETMSIGKQYVLFLYKNRDGSSALLLTGGPQGLFELESNGKVKSHARADDAPYKEANGKQVHSFLDSVRTFAKKWPNNVGCCG